MPLVLVSLQSPNSSFIPTDAIHSVYLPSAGPKSLPKAVALHPLGSKQPEIARHVALESKVR